MSARWVTFDCYGTLVDWYSGFSAILRPIGKERTPDLLDAYHRHEPQVQGERPFRSYKEVLKVSLVRAATEMGIAITEELAGSLPEQWSRLSVFDDVDDALAQLRVSGHKLGVLTNCDDDLFAQTHGAFRCPFDLVVTAERVLDYKPSLGHFRFFAEASGVKLADWVHVGCSIFHDITPARALGIKSIWLDREDAGERPALASRRISAATELPIAIARLFEEV